MQEIDLSEIRACLEVACEGFGFDRLAVLRLAKLHALIDWVAPITPKPEEEIGRALVAMVETHLASVASSPFRTAPIPGEQLRIQANYFTRVSIPALAAERSAIPTVQNCQPVPLVHEITKRLTATADLVSLEPHVLEAIAASIQAAEAQFDAHLASGQALQVRQARLTPTDDYAGIMRLDPVFYGSSPAKPVWEADELRALSQAFPEGVLIAANRSGTVLGYCIVLPVRPSFISEYLSGQRRSDTEWDLLRDILVADEARQAPSLCAFFSDICAFPLPSLRLHAALGFAKLLREKLREYPNCTRVCAIIVSEEGKRLDRMFRPFSELEAERDNGVWGLFRVWKVRPSLTDQPGRRAAMLPNVGISR